MLVLMLVCPANLEKGVSKMLLKHTILLGMMKKNCGINFLKMRKEINLKLKLKKNIKKH